MNNKYNCPNCGAPIGYSDKCEYCGTLLSWTPIVAIEYVPKHLHVRKMSVEIKTSELDEIVFREVGIAKVSESLIRELGERLVEGIISEKAFKLIQSYDFIEQVHIFKMTTYVGVET